MEWNSIFTNLQVYLILLLDFYFSYNFRCSCSCNLSPEYLKRRGSYLDLEGTAVYFNIMSYWAMQCTCRGGSHGRKKGWNTLQMQSLHGTKEEAGTLFCTPPTLPFLILQAAWCIRISTLNCTKGSNLWNPPNISLAKNAAFRKISKWLVLPFCGSFTLKVFTSLVYAT